MISIVKTFGRYTLCFFIGLSLAALARAQSATGALTVQVSAGGTPPLSLVNHGDVWRYRKGTSAPPGGWQTNADATLDGSWLSAPGGFGYGDAAIVGEATTLNDMLNGYTSLYIRKSFDIASAVDTNRHLKLTIDFDDGYVAYLDGVELSRSNAPGASGTVVPYSANATANHEASCCTAPTNPSDVLDLGPAGGRLPVGQHVLALQGLNATNNSSDFHLIADLAVAGDSSSIGGGVFFAIVKTNRVLLSGGNTVPNSARLVVNGEHAAFDAGLRTWSKTQTLTPGFNRLTVQALDSAGNTLASTNQDIVAELASSYVGGALSNSTVWDASMGIIHVTNTLVLPTGGTLSVAPGVVLLFQTGASVLATNASITVSGTATNPVYLLPSDGTTVWGGVVAAGTNGNLTMQHAETIAGHVEVLEGATGLVEDCYLHDYLVSNPPIVHALRAASLTFRRNHVQRYYEHLIQLTPVVMEDCLVENITGDGIDFDGAPPGSVIRRCTIRHGDLTNVDGLDMGNFTDGTPSRNVVIEDCLIYDFSFDKGVSIGEAAQNITVRNCVIYGVQSGVAVKDSSVAIIHNNTIVDSEYGLHLYEKIAGQGGGHATAYNNIIWGVGTNAVLDTLSTVTNRYSDLSGAGIYPGTSNINADPRFVNPATRDYHLLPNSPCIDAGDPAAPHDPDGSLADLGAVPFELSYVLPVIVVQPRSYTVAEGCDATFRVGATSPLPLSYQWKRNDADILGATNDTFVVQRVNFGLANGQYSVVVSNSVSSVTSSNAVLTVSADVTPPLITAQPQSQPVVSGSNVTFTVIALQQCTGSEGLTYQWFFNATNVIDGATNSTLVLTNVQPIAAGAYSVAVRDPDGNRTDSELAMLTVLVKPTITLQPLSQTVAQGATVTFRVQADGTPPFGYQWRAGWVPGDIPGETSDTLVVSNAQPNVAGNYRVTVSNAAGSSLSAIAVLRVVPPPSIINAGLSTTNVTFSFTSVTNHDYVVEYKDRLTDPAWSNLRIVNGNGGTLTISDGMTNAPSRFYRVRIQ